MSQDNLTEGLCALYLIRHGEAEGNAQSIVMGHLNFPLTEKGREQALAVSKKLEDIAISAIFASDLLRAKQTAEIIARERNLIVQELASLRERGYGIHEGKDKETFERDTKTTWDSVKSLTDEDKEKFQYPDGIENDWSLYQRVSKALLEIANSYLGKNVIVVTHGSAIKHLLRRIARESDTEEVIENGGYVSVYSNGANLFLK